MRIEIQKDGMCKGTHKLIIGHDAVSIFFTSVDICTVCTDLMRGGAYVSTLWGPAHDAFVQQWQVINK